MDVSVLPSFHIHWAATKAAYRLCDSSRVDENIVRAKYFAATKSRMAADKSVILILQDTAEFSFQRNQSEAIGSPAFCRVFGLAASRPPSAPC